MWEKIVHNAMIGTGKKQPELTSFPESIREAANIIFDNTSIDNEERFLQIASLCFNYRQCGFQPLIKPLPDMTPALAEVKNYCSNDSFATLKEVLAENIQPLLKIWMECCTEKNEIVQPEVLPALLDIAAQQKKLQTFILNCIGKRGEWMAGFNKAWNFTVSESDEELWFTGTPEQRNTVLAKTRATSPEKALEWLHKTWSQEDSNTKLAFLAVLDENISEADISLLEACSTEKSKKVKDKAFSLLKKIPGSGIVKNLENLLKQCVAFKKEKSFLGIVNKTGLCCNVPENLNVELKSYGIETLSNNKDFLDEQYIVYQLIQNVPPNFWEEFLKEEPKKIIHLFEKDETGNKMIPAIILSIVNFKEVAWAKEMATHLGSFYIELIPFLSLEDQQKLCNKFFEQYPDTILKYVQKFNTEWSHELASQILKFTAKNGYLFNKNFYAGIVHLLPLTIKDSLSKFYPAEEYYQKMWEGNIEYIEKLLVLKNRIIQSFNK